MALNSATYTNLLNWTATTSVGDGIGFSTQPPVNSHIEKFKIPYRLKCRAYVTM